MSKARKMRLTFPHIDLERSSRSQLVVVGETTKGTPVEITIEYRDWTLECGMQKLAERLAKNIEAERCGHRMSREQARRAWKRINDAVTQEPQ